MKKKLSFLLFSFFILHYSNAQLGREVKEKIFPRFMNKKNNESSSRDKAPSSEQTASEQTESEDNDGGMILKKMGMGSMDPSVLPDAYSFPYFYRIQMQTNGDKIDMDYYLTKKGNYFGSSLQTKEAMSLVMVYDYDKNILVNYMEGKPFVRQMPKVNEPLEKQKEADFKVVSLPSRKFLGHDCIGKQLEDDAAIIIYYVAPALGTGLTNPFQLQKTTPNSSVKLSRIPYDNGMIMYIKIIDKKAKHDDKESLIMECTAFEEKMTVLKNR